MGSTKEWMMQQENEVMIQWMRDSYNIADDVDIDEDYPGYSGMVAVYEHELQREEYESSMQWYDDHPYHEIYNAFCGRIRQLEGMVTQDKNPFTDKMILQMVYAHSVTLFEAMVGDIIKACVRKFPHMMEKLVLGIAETTKEKYSIKDIVKHGGVNGIALSILNESTFHNIGVVNQYVNILSGNRLNGRYESEMIRIAMMRHDFVHRNGANKAGEYHQITSLMVFEALEIISLYSIDVFEAIKKSAETPGVVDF